MEADNDEGVEDSRSHFGNSHFFESIPSNSAVHHSGRRSSVAINQSITALHDGHGPSLILSHKWGIQIGDLGQLSLLP